MHIIAKVGDTVDVTYQAVKEQTGLSDVTLKIFDETRNPDLVNFPDVVLTEMGTTGRYYGSFSSDAKGVWTYTVDSVTRKGPLTGTIIITDNDLDSIGDAVAALNTALNTVESNIRGADSDTLETLSDQLDSVEGPAMLA